LIGWGQDERIADLYFEDRTAQGNPAEAGLVRLVGNRLRGFLAGAVKYLDVQVSSLTPNSANRTASAAGASEDAARIDHRHAVDVAMPVSLGAGGTNTLGDSNDLSVANHKHRIEDPSSIATATALVNTTSTTFVLLSGMEITPGAGTYLVSLSCYGRAPQPQTNLSFGLAVAGTGIGHTERLVGGTAQSSDSYYSIQTQAKITVTAGQAIQGVFRSVVVGYSVEVLNRSLVLLKVDG